MERVDLIAILEFNVFLTALPRNLSAETAANDKID